MKGSGSVPEARRNAASKFGDILPGTLLGLGLGRAIRQLALIRAWDRTIPLRVRERAAFQGYKEGRLYISVEDPIWLHELHMLRHQLKTVLNEALEEPVVQEIVLRIGRVPRAHTSRALAARPQRRLVAPSAQELKVTELLASVKDLPWRDSLERLLRRWTARSI